VEIKNLKTYFYTEEGVVKAVDGVSFDIYPNEVLGLVGETGCGKSQTALSILRLVRAPGKIVEGTVKFNGTDLLTLTEEQMRDRRGCAISMIFQDPLNSLNPVLTIGYQLAEVFLLHQKDRLRSQIETQQKKSTDKLLMNVALDESAKILDAVGIADAKNILKRYPHELSGGMRQRVMIAMALICKPQLLIADEPTTALDVTIEAQILDLMKKLKEEFQTSILLITHDLGIIAEMCDRVAVMYAGQIVEYAQVSNLYHNPRHPYTIGLIHAIPDISKRGQKLELIRGMVPNPLNLPQGCRFHPRCPERMECCNKVEPKMLEIGDKYFVHCHLFDPEYQDSPKYNWGEAEMEESYRV